MSLVLFGAFDFVTTLLGIGLFIVSLFLILLVLVQRGKGGGLTGALGGMGGQSAFGTKAGDVFTKFTVGTAIVWILLCLLTIQLKNRPPQVVKEEDAVIESGMGTSTEDDALDTDDTMPGANSDAKQDSEAKQDGEAKKDEEAKDNPNKAESETESDAKKDDGKDSEAKANEKSADQPASE